MLSETEGLDGLLPVGLEPHRRLESEAQEALASKALRRSDAVGDFESPEMAEKKQAAEKIVARMGLELAERIEALPAESPPRIEAVSGASGSGKSELASRLVRAGAGVYLCGDEAKRRFSELAAEDPVLGGDARFQNASYIHRLTSPVSWGALDAALAARKSVVIEMLGTDPASDAKMLSEAAERGYVARLSHVAAPLSEALSNAVDRYFSRHGKDAGRWMSLREIAQSQAAVLEGFGKAAELLSDRCELRLFDNGEKRMALAWSSAPSRPGNLRKLGLMLAEFAKKVEDGFEALWHPGANLTADLAMVWVDPSDGEAFVALAKRGKEPYKGAWELPGGFVDGSSKDPFDPREESPLKSALAKFGAEGAGHGCSPIFVGAYDDRLRDPRNNEVSWTESRAFACFWKVPPEAGDADSVSVKWMPLPAVLSGEIPMAFDHRSILEDAIAVLGLKGRRSAV